MKTTLTLASDTQMMSRDVTDVDTTKFIEEVVAMMLAERYMITSIYRGLLNVADELLEEMEIISKSPEVTNEQ